VFECGGEDVDLEARIDEISSELDDGEQTEAQAGIILFGLGFTKEMQAKRTKEFSGGWRMRIALACALFKKPTLLLLDEPTNHLDMEAVIWLEN
jgi:ATP-binding cassette subfamily F protein 2